jgi:hypothetical protein
MDLVEVQGPLNIKGIESLEGLVEGDKVEIKITRDGVEDLVLMYEPGEGNSVISGHISFEVNEE